MCWTLIRKVHTCQASPALPIFGKRSYFLGTQEFSLHKQSCTLKETPSLNLRGIYCQLNNEAPLNLNDVIQVMSACPQHCKEQKRHNLLKKNSAVGSKFPEMIKFWSAPDYYSCNCCICEACWPEAKGFQMHLH